VGTIISVLVSDHDNGRMIENACSRTRKYKVSAVLCDRYN